MKFISPSITKTSFRNCLGDIESQICTHFGLDQYMSNYPLNRVEFEENSLIFYCNNLISKKMGLEKQYISIEYDWEGSSQFFANIDIEEKAKFLSIFNVRFDDFVEEFNCGWSRVFKVLDQNHFFTNNTKVIAYDFEMHIGQHNIIFYIDGDLSDELNAFSVEQKLLSCS